MSLTAWLCGSDGAKREDRFDGPGDYTLGYARDLAADDEEVTVDDVVSCWGKGDAVAQSWGDMCAANLVIDREHRRCMPELLSPRDDSRSDGVSAAALVDAAGPANWPSDYVLDLARDDGAGSSSAAPGEPPAASREPTEAPRARRPDPESRHACAVPADLAGAGDPPAVAAAEALLTLAADLAAERLALARLLRRGAREGSAAWGCCWRGRGGPCSGFRFRSA